MTGCAARRAACWVCRPMRSRAACAARNRRPSQTGGGRQAHPRVGRRGAHGHRCWRTASNGKVDASSRSRPPSPLERLALLRAQADGRGPMTGRSKPEPVRRLRRAVYTRKSSEEGLDMEFNNLDAQRKACEAYIASQRAEGLARLREHYDDGGFSGGTLDRPGAEAVDRRYRRRAGRCGRRLQDRPPRPRADGFLQAGRNLRPPWRHLRLGDAVVQHHPLNGTADAEHPALLRPVRARGDRRTHPRQDRRLEEEGHVDGRLCAPRL